MTAVSDTTDSRMSTTLAATGPARPIPGVPPPERALRSFHPGREAWVWFVGAHGGAGESTLAELLPGAAAADHRWPFYPEGLTAGLPNVVLVARTSASGLLAAQAAAAQWAAGATPAVRLLGLVCVADAPGRLPRPLRELADLIAGGVPRRWDLPWVEQWRTGEPAGPKLTARLFADLATLTES